MQRKMQSQASIIKQQKTHREPHFSGWHASKLAVQDTNISATKLTNDIESEQWPNLKHFSFICHNMYKYQVDTQSSISRPIVVSHHAVAAICIVLSVDVT
jgi:hypothetical protein